MENLRKGRWVKWVINERLEKMAGPTITQRSSWEESWKECRLIDLSTSIDVTTPTSITESTKNLKSSLDGTHSKQSSGAQPNFWGLPDFSELRQKQLKDPDIGPVLKWKAAQKWPPWTEVCYTSPATQHYWLHITDRVLFRKFTKWDGTGYYVQFLVPQSMKEVILHQMHDALPSRHLGKRKTRGRLLR